MKAKKKSSLRIAAILGDRLFQGIRFEGELLPLTPSRINSVLQYGRPDILLVESVNLSHDGFWNTSASSELSQQEAVTSVVSKARAIKLPTVFWLTVGHEEFESYRRTIELFDLIACADPKSVDLLLKEGRKAIYLPPCVQTAIFNPFRNLDDHNALDLNILFDKGADLLEFDEARSAIEGLDGYGLTVIESRNFFWDKSMPLKGIERDKHSFASNSPDARLAALKNSKSYLCFSRSKSTWVEQQWMALEAAACRLAVVLLGRLDSNELLSDVLIDCNSEGDLLLELCKYSKDSLYRERVAHLAWRCVNQNHTFSHRIAQLCRELGLANDCVKFPKVSVITTTFRNDLIKKCIQQYDEFIYPNKELVLIFNGNNIPHPMELHNTDRDDIKVSYVPTDLLVGEALNLGHLIASGTYLFRVDDDDYYGPNYLMDMVLCARTIQADLFGKSPVPLKYEGEDAVYAKANSSDFHILEIDRIYDGMQWLGGNTIAGKAEFFRLNSYNDHVYGAADTAFQLSINNMVTPLVFSADRFNCVALRRNDVSSHTWRDVKEKTIANRYKVEYLDDLFI